MKKNIVIAFVLAFFVQASAFAQLSGGSVRHYPGKVKYQKEEVDATVFEVPYSRDEVEEGMRKLADKRNAKIRQSNGFYEVKNVAVEAKGGKVCDMYYKVEKDGKNASKVYVILVEPGEDVAKRSSSHAAVYAAAGGAGVAAAVGTTLDENNHDFRVKDQEADIKSAEKKYNSLVEEQKKLEKKKADLEKEIEKNVQDQNRLQQEIAAKKEQLDAFKGVKKDKQ